MERKTHTGIGLRSADGKAPETAVVGGLKGVWLERLKRITAGVVSLAMIAGGGVGVANAVQRWRPTFRIPADEAAPAGAGVTVSDTADGEGDPAEAYSAFLSVLEAECDKLAAYERMDTELFRPREEGEDYSPVKKTDVAFGDIYGDGTPEMIYIKAAGKLRNGRHALTTINIVTFENGSVRNLYTGQWDRIADTGFYFTLFQMEGEKTLYARVLEKDARQTDADTYFRFSENGDGTLFKEEILKCDVELSEVGGWHYAYTWTRRGAKIGEKAYKTLEDGMIGATRAVLLCSPCFAPASDGKPQAVEPGGMTVREATDHLKTLLGEKETPETADDSVFSMLEGISFTFSSGAGAWQTELTIHGDGSFDGTFWDAEMGVTGDAYPNGTCLIRNFSGQFKCREKCDDHSYLLTLDRLTYREPLADYYEDGVRYEVADAYGVEGGKTFMLYLPGAITNDLPEEYTDWVGYSHMRTDYDAVRLPFFGLYNVEEKEGFCSQRVLEDNAYDEEELAALKENLRFHEMPDSTEEIGIALDGTETLDLNWGWSLFDRKAGEYSHELAVAGCALNMAAESGQKTVEDALSALGFENPHSVAYSGKEESGLVPAMTFASARFEQSGKDRVLIAAVLHDRADTLDRLTDPSYLLDGFYGAADSVSKELRSYCGGLSELYGIELDRSNTALYITGYGVAGALAGLTAEKAGRLFSNDIRVFAYTFASPCYQNAEYEESLRPWDLDEEPRKLSNVHNILCTKDALTHFPYGYQRLGQNWYYAGGGSDITERHSTDAYLQCLLNSPPKKNVGGDGGKYSFSSVSGQADIRILAPDGSLMARTEGSTVHYGADPKVAVITQQDDTKYLYAPEGTAYTLVFTGRADGRLAYTRKTVNIASQRVSAEKTFLNVGITAGKVLCCGIETGQSAEDARLFTVDAEGRAQSSVLEGGEESPALIDAAKHSAAFIVLAAGGIVLLCGAVLFRKREKTAAPQ